jgi:hypothetical protein
MKATRRFFRGSLLILAGYLIVPTGGMAQNQSEPRGYSTSPQDQTECKTRLNIIYAALQQYRKKHNGQLPAKLSDLGQDLIADANTFVCPYVENRGGLRHWKKRFRDWANDSDTSYSYEMSTTRLDSSHWRGDDGKTWRDFKEGQRAEVGLVVPIVRCLDHRPCLTLAMDGGIYESGEYWERNYSNDDHLLTVANFFKVKNVRSLSERDFPLRDPGTGSRLLDLTRFYNGSLTNGWQGFSGNHLQTLPTGVQGFDGVRFDVRGVIQVRGTELPGDFPAQVSGIPVHQKCSRIHFLHAVSFEYKADTIQAIYRMKYSDDTEKEFRVVYGQHIADWWHVSTDRTAPAKAPVAWTGENQASKAFDRVTSLYHATWENPSPNVEIATIAFDAGSKPYLAGPFVVAITLE